MTRALRWFLVLTVLAIVTVAAVVQGPSRVPLVPGGSVVPIATGNPPPAGVVALADFLPRPHAQDGSVDYTTQAQSAFDAAAGKTLLLPPYPVRVSRRPGTTHCLIVRKSLSVQGTQGARIVETQGGVQILRFENVDGVTLTNFTLRGKGGQGRALAHGILQVFASAHVRIDGVNIEDSDADGIAIADSRVVQVVNCRVERVSKAGIYLSRCTDAVVSANVVLDGIGHFTAQNQLVGSAIQLSSNVDLVCANNTLARGVGIGILCDANSTNVTPRGNVLTGNRIAHIANPQNVDVSGGIRCTNATTDCATSTLLTNNSIEDCGWNGIYVERHDYAVLVGNMVRASSSSGVVVSSARGVYISGNTILDSDMSGVGGQAAIYLINTASEVLVRGNRMANTSALAQGATFVRDSSSAGGHSLEPSLRFGSGPPSSGSWNRGDLVFHSSPSHGSPAGWSCLETGSPGVWASFGRVE
jgi:hypothetical protein